MRIHHVAFRTDDLPRLERFYVDALGLAITKRSEPRSIWLDAGGTILMLELRDPGEPTLPADSKELIAFTLDPASLPLVKARLARANVPIEASTDFTIYLRDPDGRRVGLSSYPVKLP